MGGDENLGVDVVFLGLGEEELEEGFFEFVAEVAGEVVEDEEGVGLDGVKEGGENVEEELGAARFLGEGDFGFGFGFLEGDFAVTLVEKELLGTAEGFKEGVDFCGAILGEIVFEADGLFGFFAGDEGGSFAVADDGDGVLEEGL